MVFSEGFSIRTLFWDAVYYKDIDGRSVLSARGRSSAINEWARCHRDWSLEGEKVKVMP
jgi:hypothetical protein